MGEKLVCTRYQKVAFASTGHKKAIFTRLRCKQWDCDACAKTNAWIWRNWLLERLPDVSNEWWLVTLTASENTRSRMASMDNLRTHIDAFFKRAKRVFGSLEYVRVYEPHPTSEAVHVHLIVSGLSPFVAVGCSVKLRPMSIGVLSRSGRNGVWALRTWVKINARELKMGYIADARRIEGSPQSAVWYVTKYLTKAQSELHVKGLRHVQVTKGIGSPPKIDTDLVWNTAAYITAEMVGHKTDVTDLNNGFVIHGDDYWEVHSFYPYE